MLLHYTLYKAFFQKVFRLYLNFSLYSIFISATSNQLFPYNKKAEVLRSASFIGSAIYLRIIRFLDFILFFHNIKIFRRYSANPGLSFLSILIKYHIYKHFIKCYNYFWKFHKLLGRYSSLVEH